MDPQQAEVFHLSILSIECSGKAYAEEAWESAQLEQVKPNEPITFHHSSKQVQKFCITC